MKTKKFEKFYKEFFDFMSERERKRMMNTYYGSTYGRSGVLVRNREVWKPRKSIEQRCRENALEGFPREEKKFMYDEKNDEIYNPLEE